MKKIALMLGAVIMVGSLGLATQSLATDDSGGREIMFKTVKFSHESHVEGMGFECDSCHDGLFEMEAGSARKSANFNMKGLREGLYCGGCHDGSTAFSSDSECSGCHIKNGGDIVFDEPVKAVVFSHDYHNKELGFGCDACHSGTFEMSAREAQQNSDFTMKGLDKGKYCGDCHDGDGAFASTTRCATCHVGAKGFARLTGSVQPHHNH